MSEKRKCVNCRHRIIGENCSSKCEIDGHRIDYAECFEGWCRHWAKENKLFVCPDQPEEIEAKFTDFENTEVAKSFEQELREHNQNSYNKWRRSKLQVKIDGKDFGLWSGCDERTYAKEPIKDGEIEGLRPIAEVVKKQILTDIRDYLVSILDEWHKRIDEPNFYEQNIGVYNHIRKELDDLTEYAEKLGVEL